jgi:hypothetical protein
VRSALRRLRGALGEVLVIAEAAQDRARANERKAEPGAQQWPEHLRIEEPGAVEQREHEIDLGPLEQHFERSASIRLSPSSSRNRADLDVIDRMVAILGMEPAAPQRVLGDEQDAQAFPGLGRDGEGRNRR